MIYCLFIFFALFLCLSYHHFSYILLKQRSAARAAPRCPKPITIKKISERADLTISMTPPLYLSKRHFWQPKTNHDQPVQPCLWACPKLALIRHPVNTGSSKSVSLTLTPNLYPSLPQPMIDTRAGSTCGPHLCQTIRAQSKSITHPYQPAVPVLPVLILSAADFAKSARALYTHFNNSFPATQPYRSIHDSKHNIYNHTEENYHPTKP